MINTASLAALVPMPSAFVVYQAAKAAVLCPGPVRTNIHEVSKNRPPHFAVGEAFRDAEQSGATQVPFPSMMDPADVGARVLEAVRQRWSPCSRVAHEFGAALMMRRVRWSVRDRRFHAAFIHPFCECLNFGGG